LTDLVSVDIGSERALALYNVIEKAGDDGDTVGAAEE
jgi:hypothetical protein